MYLLNKFHPSCISSFHLFLFLTGLTKCHIFVMHVRHVSSERAQLITNHTFCRFYPIIYVLYLYTMTITLQVYYHLLEQIIKEESTPKAIKPHNPEDRPSANDTMVTLKTTVGSTLKQALDRLIKELTLDSSSSGDAGKKYNPRFSKENSEIEIA